MNIYYVNSQAKVHMTELKQWAGVANAGKMSNENTFHHLSLYQYESVL
jgi:hypothetical protein